MVSEPPLTWAATVWQRHQADLRRFLGRLIRNPTELDDVIATTYEVLVRARDNARGADERLFVLGVGANVARHHLRKEQRSARLEEALSAEAPLRGHASSPELHVETMELEADLAWAIGQLNPEQQSLILKLNEGATAAEVSRLLGEPEATVRSRAHHARKKLKTLLQQRWLIIALLALLGAVGYAAYRFVVAKARESLPPLPREKVEAPSPRSPEPSLATPAPSEPPVTPTQRTAAERATAAKSPTAPALQPNAVPAVTPSPAPKPPDALELFEEANRAHFTEQSYERALAGWTTFLQRFPDAALADDARFNRVVALFKLGRLAEARGDAQATLKRTPATAHRTELEKLIQLIDASR